LSTTHGTLLSVDLRALPSNLALMDGAQDAGQAQAEWRQFVQLTPGTVLAHRLAGGGSLGQPGYEERYSLGGTGQLRGFQDNRFRGRQFYCMQEEVRVPLYKALSMASSVDLGDVSDGELGRPRHSVQAGLRAGLPPSYGMKARLDVGYGDSGEHSLALQFGETF
jgi:outer membrane protein insertion porin family